MIKRCLIALVFLLVSVGVAFSLQKVGTFGEGVQFYVDKKSHSVEEMYNTVAVQGHMVNQYGYPAKFELQMVCRENGSILVNFNGKRWEMRLKSRNDWMVLAPSMGGFFVIYDRYCIW